MIKVVSAKDAVTKTGKPYKQLEVECEGEVRKVNMWSNYPNFANITEGSEFEGKMVKEGQYWNLPFESATSRPGGSGGFKTAQIKESMERKEGSIAKFQDNKEWSIKTASTMNKAVDLAIAEIKDITTLNTLERDILKWREWLWKNWDVKEDQYPPF